MGWKSVFSGFAALVALCLGASAQNVSAPASEPAIVAAQTASPALRAPTDAVPRYATMIPPTRQEDVSSSAAPPVAAPTARVAVSQADTIAPAAPPLRYSTMDQPRPVEQVTVTGLRQLQDGLYRLGPGDKLHLTVFNETDLSGDFAVDGQGFVRLPLIGQVPAAGLTTFALEARIADAFVNGGFLVNPRVSVEITSYRPFYIIGEVAKPGEYAYVNSMSAPNAIALAGGYTERAVESTIWVRHEGEAKEHEYAADETTRIYPGDVIRVSRSTYWSIITLLSPIISPFSAIAYLLK